MEKKICIIEGCNNQLNSHCAKGLCIKHYQRYLKYGDSLFTKFEMHGMEKSKEYKTWRNMKLRCYNKKDINYNYYGGRSIKVCDKWKHSFINFYNDMGDKPTLKHQIDRINNDGNYEPGNCRWVTSTENNRNQSTTKLTLTKAKKIRNLCINSKIYQKDIAIEYGVSLSTVNDIYYYRTWREE